MEPNLVRKVLRQEAKEEGKEFDRALLSPCFLQDNSEKLEGATCNLALQRQSDYSAKCEEGKNHQGHL